MIRPFMFLMPCITLVAGLALAQDANWPCFRGPGRRGVSAEKGLPLTWSDTSNLAWKTRLPGAGASSPITWGDHIYLTCYSGYGLNFESPGKYEELKRHVVCLARGDGRILWDAAFANQVPDDHWANFINLHGYASGTPAADESGVYVFFGTNGLRAYGHDGKLRWERSCGTRYTNYGSGASPVLFGDLVIVNAAVESHALIAFDKQSGQERWRRKLDGMARSAPLVAEAGGRSELIFHLGEDYSSGKASPSGLAAVDPRTGRDLWQCNCLNTYLNPSPIAHAGVIYAIGGYPNRAVAIRGGGQGEVAGTHLLWDIAHGSEVGTPIFHDGHLYWANEESGIVYCVRAADGQLVYKQRLDPRPGRIYASPVIADGKLYYLSREQGTFVLPAAPRYELLAHNKLASDTSIFNATPAVSRGQLLLRSDRYLYCLGTPNPQR